MGHSRTHPTSRASRVVRLSALGCLCSCFAFSALAQAIPPPQSPELPNVVFKRNVRRVVLDVVVSGVNDQPVVGLTRDDFTIAEDGKKQRVLSLDAHNFDGPASFVPPVVPALPANTFVDLPDGPERGPLYLLVYDMANIERDDQPYARLQLLKFLEKKPAGARFALLVLSDGTYLVQGFTDDKQKLLAALGKGDAPHVPGIFLSGVNYGRSDTGHSIYVFKQIVDYLEGLPGRKNLIWLSGQFPLSVFPTGDNPAADTLEYTQEIKDIINQMARDQIAIYPVDVTGVVVNDDISSGADSSANMNAPADPFSPRNRGGLGGRASDVKGHQTAPGYSLLARSYMTQDEIANETGGHAFHNTNGLAEALDEAVRVGGSYYTLTYSPENEKYDGRMRHIHVEIAKSGYRLAYRRYYFADDPGVPKTQPLQDGSA